MKRRNEARRRKKFSENYGTERRVQWFKEQPCACVLEVDDEIRRHPSCTGYPSQNSHTKSKAVGGDARHIIPQSDGCHRFIGDHGWSRWCADVGELHGANTLDRQAEAAIYATMGPDAPGADARGIE